MDVVRRPVSPASFLTAVHSGGAVVLRLVFATLLVSVPAAAASSPAAAPSDARQAELGRLVRNDCGACHGMTLKGGLGLPLTPEALREKDDESLVYVILNGRAPTPMPPWKAFITEGEARWIVAKLRTGAFAGATR